MIPKRRKVPDAGPLHSHSLRTCRKLGNLEIQGIAWSPINSAPEVIYVSRYLRKREFLLSSRKIRSGIMEVMEQVEWRKSCNSEKPLNEEADDSVRVLSCTKGKTN